MEGVLLVTGLCVVAAAMPGLANGGDDAFLRVVRSIFVDKVWSGAPVGFALTTRGKRQYVAYYDANRQMTVACRDLASEKWTYERLDDHIGWDSHNYVALAFDSEGYIHLSGNMHCVPLRYYRTTKPEDITTFVRVESMTGENEQRCTYPRFGSTPDGALTFSYRDGGSGNGNEIVNVYDMSTRKWRRLIEKPLFDGEGERNAYYSGPLRDKRGFYHLAWVWRDDPDCSTNHDVSCARSPNYRDSFQKSDGTPTPLPLTLRNSEIIDPVPVKAGLLNNVKLSLDSHDRVMVSYFKFDQKGRTQIYTARREEPGWRIYQTTDWTDRWDFSGGGTIPTMISFSAPEVWRDGRLCQLITNKCLGQHDQVRFLDEATLRQVGEPVRLFPHGFTEPPDKPTEDWQVNVRGVSFGALERDGRTWALRWESAGPNRDRPRDSAPPPSRLEVVELAAR